MWYVPGQILTVYTSRRKENQFCENFGSAGRKTDEFENTGLTGQLQYELNIED